MNKLTIFAVLTAMMTAGCEASEEKGFPQFGETKYYDCGDSFKRLAVTFDNKENGKMTTITSVVELGLASETETERVYNSKSSYMPYGFVVTSDGKASFKRYKELIPCEISKE